MSAATTSAGGSPASCSGTRVLMLTAAGTIEDRVDGLGLGADDYLPKPFAFAELVARVRHWRAGPPRRFLPHPGLRGASPVDPARRAAFRAGRRLEPSARTEFALLEMPARHTPGPLALSPPRNDFLAPSSGTRRLTFFHFRGVKHTIHRLRAKLGDPPVIETIREGGYRISQ